VLSASLLLEAPQRGARYLLLRTSSDLENAHARVRPGAKCFVLRASLSAIGQKRTVTTVALTVSKCGVVRAERLAAPASRLLYQLEPPASLIFSCASSIVNEPGFCAGGNSLSVAMNFATIVCALIMM